jgi:alanyl-tRNA synthetase
MLSDKEIKKKFQKTALQEFEKNYPVKALKELKFKRKQCKKCKRNYWSQTENEICGDSYCEGKLTFIGKTPCKKKIEYIDVWKEYCKIHEKLGYTPIKRYPVIARWNPTTEFTIASIAAFQPYVVSGEINPPANPLVIPQFCLRFNDIDNVGITGHNVGFIMLGEHAFVEPKKYDINKYFKDHLTWLEKGMGIPLEEIKIHEDVWAGGGNFGPCVEFFSRGLEISNQVYMQYESTQNGEKELQIKVLDMGQGYERIAWFTQGAINNYETMSPPVLKKLREKTKVTMDQKFGEKFYPLSPRLNCDEVEDIEKEWEKISKETKIPLGELKEKAKKQAALYSILEHSRALLFAINDGGLPSNVGGMYNLRVILRRAIDFIEKYNWKINLGEICELHSEYLKPLFPELQKNIENVKKILQVETEKYKKTKEKIKNTLPKIIKEKIDINKLIELYDSQGITPELISTEAEKQGKKINIPKNFYALVSEKHEKKIQETQTKKEHDLDLKNFSETECLYFEDYRKTKFLAEVIGIIGKKIILDKTMFYPTSGGQIHDKGHLNGQEIIEVFKQGNVIIHTLKEDAKFKTGEIIEGNLDFERRVQLSQHHTATHIINTAARKILGHHINQAGAKKETEKSQLDITHYESLTEEETKKIEDQANKISSQAIPIIKTFMPREEAEKKYGMSIYQGGAVPGKILRIVEIKDLDIEACGGTHLNNTSETGKIKIIKTTKIQDGIVRITFTAGKASRDSENKQDQELKEIAKILEVEIKEIPARTKELFEKWKQKIKKKKQMTSEELQLKNKEKFEGSNEEILIKTAEILKTQPEHIINTIKRFMKEIHSETEKKEETFRK